MNENADYPDNIGSLHEAKLGLNSQCRRLARLARSRLRRTQDTVFFIRFPSDLTATELERWIRMQRAAIYNDNQHKEPEQRMVMRTDRGQNRLVVGWEKDFRNEDKV